MTKAVDKVLKIIQDKYSKNWVDTKTIAEDAGLSRSVISIYLSQLYKENKLTKKMAAQFCGNLSLRKILFKI
ncbi:hypothetical protein [Companilactobacillus halodurans]|uniref:Uncharacterized protein n=1 Tax=Companilactobacillus halodurans TaxID=2584183 RepID=A0A5P0ZWK3_9LACO|nr:hypothetical protein [Companilactobacillus halodurans]MQS97285.1 hypothetical protein [Companilactobacillus halodurans]